MEVCGRYGFMMEREHLVAIHPAGTTVQGQDDSKTQILKKESSVLVRIRKQPGLASRLPHRRQHHVHRERPESETQLPAQRIVVHDVNIEARHIDEDEDHRKHNDGANEHGACDCSQVMPERTVAVTTVEGTEHDDQG